MGEKNTGKKEDEIVVRLLLGSAPVRRHTLLVSTLVLVALGTFAYLILQAIL